MSSILFKRIKLFCGLTLLLLSHSCGLEMTDTRYLIHNTTILTINEQDDVIENGSILIEDDRIVKIYQHRVDPDTIGNIEVIDGTNKITIPGLINMHAHSAMVLFRGLGSDTPLEEWLEEYMFPAEKAFVDSAFVDVGVTLAAAEMIRSGTTTFNDMYFYAHSSGLAIEKTGMRAVICESCMDFPTPATDDKTGALEVTSTLFEKWENHPLITVAICPHSTYLCDPECLKACHSIADKYAAPVHIHLSETKQENKTVLDRYGMTPTELLDELGIVNQRLIGAHAVYLNERDQELLLKNNSSIVHNPMSNLKLGSGVAPVFEYWEKGINVAIGTDGAASNNNLDLLEEMRLASYLQKGVTGKAELMPAGSILRMATINGAKALGMDRDIGSIEPGKKADLVLIDTDSPRMQPVYDPVAQVVYTAKGDDVASVMINGRWVMRQGELLTIDEDKILKEASHYREMISRAVEAGE